MRDACDIDKLRDLIRRQHRAKHDSYGGMFANTLDTAGVERQLVTYLSQSVTVAAFEKCVKDLEVKSLKRVERERKESEQRDHTRRIRAICDATIELARGNSISYIPICPFHRSVFGSTAENYPPSKGRQLLKDGLIKDCERVKKDIDNA